MTTATHSTHPGGLKNALQLAGFELYKLIFHRRGTLAMIAFALVWLLILTYPVRGAASFLLNPDFKHFVTGAFGEGTLDQLFAWPVAEQAVYWVISLYLFPMFSILICGDQFASDKNRGTLRFLCLRSGRDALFFGRFLGMMLIQLLLVAITVIATVFLAMSRDMALVLPALTSGLMMTLNLVLILLPYTALMALFSLWASSARLASVFAVLFFAVMMIVMATINAQLPMLSFIGYLVPGAQIDAMLNAQPLTALSSAWLPLLQTIGLLAIGRTMMQRGDL